MAKSNLHKSGALLLSAALSLSLGGVAPWSAVGALPAMAAPGGAWLDNENSFLDRGKRCFNTGQFDQALRELTGCIRLNPKRSEALYYRSMVYSALKENDPALADLDQAIRVDQNNPVLFLNRGLIYSNQGKHQSAVSDFDEALRLDPGLREARQNRDFCMKEIEKGKATTKIAENSGSGSATTGGAGTASAAGTISGAGSSTTAATGTTGGSNVASNQYVPYTGKPSARLAALQREQKEAETRLMRDKAEATRYTTEKARLEEKKAELALREKEAEVRLEEARVKREEAEAQKLAMAANKHTAAPEKEETAKPAKGHHPAKTGGKPEKAGTAEKANDGDALEIVNRPVRDKWALVIGISEFQDSSLNLHYPAKDAKDFYDFLVSEGNFAKDHVRLLTNKQATHDNILEELGDTWLPHVANPDDLVLIYISSHGSPSEMDKGGEGVNYLVAYDTNIEKLYATGINMHDLTSAIKKRVHSNRIVLVLDACHSGGADAGAKGIHRTKNVDADAIAQGSGQLVISSSSTDQVSWESKAYQNSVFTRCLIDSLKTNGSKTTLDDAFKNMKDRVQSQVLKERGVLQVPVLSSAWKGGDLLIGAPPASPHPAE